MYLSTLKSNCYYSIVYFDYELKFFYYYPKTYFIRKLINITFSVIDSYLISILTEHLGLIFRFNYPEISDEYFQSIVSPNIFTFVSISDIIIRRGCLTNCVSCFFRANNDLIIKNLSKYTLINYQSQIVKDVIKNKIISGINLISSGQK